VFIVHLHYKVVFIHTNYLDFFLHLQRRILPVTSAENIRISPPHFTRCNIRILPQATARSTNCSYRFHGSGVYLKTTRPHSSLQQ